MTIIRADAFHLPFPDRTFDIVVADPPFDIGKNKAGRGKRGVSVRPYIGFRGRQWWREAWRTLKDTGRLYVFCAITELPAWLSPRRRRPSDVLAWHAPNAISIAAKYSKANGMRGRTWRPIIEWAKPDAPDLQTVDGLATANSIAHSLISYPMHECLPWPNQVPLTLMRWLLAPVPGPLVLDLFAGTGTTRIAATELGKVGISVEGTREAITINRRRAGRLPLRFESP